MLQIWVMLVMNMVNDSTSTFALLLWEGGIVATAAPNMMGDYCSFLQWSTAAHMGTKASVYSTFELYMCMEVRSELNFYLISVS